MTLFPSSLSLYSTIVVTPLASVVSVRVGASAVGRVSLPSAAEKGERETTDLDSRRRLPRIDCRGEVSMILWVRATGPAYSAAILNGELLRFEVESLRKRREEETVFNSALVR